MTAYTLQLSCHTCGQTVTPITTGRPHDHGTNIRAIAHCTPCHLNHLIEVNLTTRATNQPQPRQRRLM